MAQAQSITGGAIPAAPAATTQAAATTTAAVAKADPAPLGLAAFALTTFVLSIGNAGLVSNATLAVVVGLALGYGGLAQVLAGMWEFRNGNTFGATAFTSYGCFWLSFALFVFLFQGKDSTSITGAYLVAWGVFTFYMWIATLRHARPVMLVFLLLWVTFIVLGAGDLSGNTTVHNLGGYLGILTAIAAWYASFAAVINSTFGRVVAPVFPLKR